MKDPALKIPRLRVLLAPESRLAVERSGKLETMHRTVRAAAELPTDEMLAAWRDLLSLKVCETLNAQGSTEQMMWAEFAISALPDGEAKDTRLNALRPLDLSSDPLSWRDHVTSTDGEGSSAVSVHWTEVMLDGREADFHGSWSTSGATPPDTPRGNRPRQNSGEGLSGPV